MGQRYAWWIGAMCEIAPESRVAEMLGESKMTFMRIDLARIRRMLSKYKIPDVEWISVDEVYARAKGPKDESRNKHFFTVISDLKSRRVIWVSESRDKVALDEFYQLIGPEACKKIRVVAMDQHDLYKASTEAHCPNTMVVWDRFHLMQGFNQVANELRRDVFEDTAPKVPLK